MMLKFLLLLTLVNIALAQRKWNRRKCTPSQWEGIEGLSAGYIEKGVPKSMQGSIKVSYDAENEKIAAFSDVYADGQRVKAKVILDYEKKLMYVITGDLAYCNVTKLDAPFQKACVPADQKPVIDTHFGTGTDSLDVSIYNLKRMGIYASVTFTNELYIPVGESLQGEWKGVKFMENIGFIGIEKGIKDPTVFDPPIICNKYFNMTIAEHQLSHPLRRIYTKMSNLGF